MKMKCKECGGFGAVEFTVERGGPMCNSCGGEGHLTPKNFRVIVATILDHPSVYMGGPSRYSLRRADKIIEALEAFEVWE